MTYALRPASADDAAAIGDVQLRCWRQTYTNLVSEEFFARWTPESMRTPWLRALRGRDGRVITVATASGEIVGFASSGPSRDTPPARELELYSIYLLAEHHGSGLGQQLLEHVVGGRPASLWMAKDNPRAFAFYRRNGFAPDGVERVFESWENLEELRLVR